MALKEKQIGQYTVMVDYDEDCPNPREDDDLSIIYSNHRYYNPDNHDIDELLDGDNNLVMDGKVGLAVWLFEHSQCCFKTAELGAKNPFGDGMYAQFDSGIFGVIAMPIEKAKQEWGDDWEEKAKNWMRGEIETFNQWQQGQVYYWKVEDNEGYIVEMLGGYYDEDEAFQEGIAEAKAYNENDKKEIERFLNEGSLAELKGKFYEMATEAPIWADEVFELVDEDKAKEWLRGKLREFLQDANNGEDWEEVG